MAALLEVALYGLLLILQVRACPETSMSETITAGFETNNSLQDVLANVNTSSVECVNVYLLPGTHVLSRRTLVRKSLSLQLHPDYLNDSLSQAIVTCNSSTVGGPAVAGNVTEELAVLSVLGASFARLSGLVFEDCSLPIQFFEVDELVIKNSTFRNFITGGAVNVYNCSNAKVSDSFFLNNTAEGIFLDRPYRGNGGGLSFGVHNVFGVDVPRYVVQDCVFESNSAQTNATQRRTTTDIIASRVFNGRGGGLAFVVSHPSALSILVTRSVFRNNFVVNFAGGLYFFMADESMEMNYTVTDCKFIDNVADVGGGGIGIGFSSDGTFGRENFVRITNVTLSGNRADFGGGLYIIPGDNGGHGNLVFMEKCTLTANVAGDYGAAVAMAALQGYLDHSLLRDTTYTDNVFERNVGGIGGVLSTYYFPVVFRGNNRFFKNSGTSLRVVSALVRIHGKLAFVANDNQLGAAVYLSSFGQLQLFRGTEVDFTNNTGSVAAAIEVEPLYVEPFLVGVPGNPQCFIIYEFVNQVQKNWNATIAFNGNKADIGAAIFTREVGLCGFVSFNTPFVDIHQSFRTMPFRYHNNINFRQSSPNSTRFDVATPPVNFSVRHMNTAEGSALQAYPGEDFHVFVSGWDELGNPTQGVYRIQENEDESDNEYSLRFSPSSINVFPNDPRITMQFGSSVDDYDEDEHAILFENERTSRTDSFLADELHVVPELCPPGMVFTNSSTSLYKCRCDTENEDLLSCEPNGYDIILRQGMWGSSYRDESNLNHVLVTVTCPPGYCKCTTNTSQNDSLCHYVTRHNNDNYQCQCFREGVLCGSCGNGTSVSALLDNCVRCGDVNSIVIVVLILVDAAVILTVMLVSLWKPIHLPAWLYPFLFYIQIAPYVAKFFPFTFELFQPYLGYIGSLTSLYFPYDFCLYSNATAVEVYALKYIPFILALILCPTVLLLARAVRVKVNFSGVWLLLMILFNQVVHTSVIALSCVSVPNRNGVTNSVWYYDGEVQCFSGGHAVLAVWAIVSIAIILFLMFAPLIIVVKPMIVKYRQLRSIRDAIVYVYRDRYYWCYIIELLRRFLIIVVLIATPATVSGTQFLLAVVFMWYAYTKPYKHRPVNYLEMVLLANFIIILLLYQLSYRESYFQELQSVRLKQSVGECNDAQYTPTGRAILLAFFYYTPLLVLPLVLVWYIVAKLRAVKRHRSDSKGHPTDNNIELMTFTSRKATLVIDNVIDLDTLASADVRSDDKS